MSKLDLPHMDRPVAEAWEVWTPEQRATFLRALGRKLFTAPKRETAAEVAQRHAYELGKASAPRPVPPPPRLPLVGPSRASALAALSRRR